MKALGYHIYAGGFTVGVSKHFKVLAHLEEKPAYGRNTCKANFPKLDIREGKDNWNQLDFVPGIGMKSNDNIDFFFGNPPCAAFSRIGKHQGVDDPRLGMHREFHKLVALLQPTVAALESVQGILTLGSELIEEFKAMCDKNHYACYIVKHDAKYLGVPQERKRVFLIASKVKLDFFKFPLTEPMSPKAALKNIKHKDKKFDVNQMYPAGIPVIKWTRPGQAMQEGFDIHHKGKKLKRNRNGTIKGRPSFNMMRLHPDKVSGTVTGFARAHFKENRYCNINEIKALCSYPQDYKLATTNWEEAQRHLTRAVMPAVGEWLAKVVKAGIRKYELPTKLVETIDVKPQV